MRGSPNDAEEKGPVVPGPFNGFSYSAPARRHSEGCSFNFHFFPLSHILRLTCFTGSTPRAAASTKASKGKLFPQRRRRGRRARKLRAHNSTICRSGRTLGLYLDILSAEVWVQLSVKIVSKNSLFLTTAILINIKITTALAIVHETIIVSKAKSFSALTFTRTPREALVTERLIIKYRLISFCKCVPEKKNKKKETTIFQR